ncbi:MAG: arsenosugar biosynthesis radical SAM protein ArsS [Planctomycetaceae bacterium]|nr:arsenosugar biosynthesis radical SAM protein ArsS [Planctomycetaceae bacterium]
MPQASTSLNHRNAPLSVASEQLRILNNTPTVSFAAAVENHGFHELRSSSVEILQVNVGKLCNMTCRHCHVDAGPDRREIMTRETIDECLAAIRGTDIHTLDLTGGAPEMNPDFRYFVTEARKLGVHVIDRCNLTILLAKGYEEMAGFLAEQQVEIVASLPCYLEQNTDSQRGDGAYRQSIEALQLLNRLGYGQPDSELKLTLVFNPVGPSLPPEQTQLEAAYRDYLRQEFQIEFNRLFTITNMPISRYLEDLLESGQYEAYMQKLIDAFNPAALAGVMCRQTLSVSWDGQLYDCDFNQMLELPTSPGLPQRIGDFDQNLLKNRQIAVGQHCFGCTAGSGSSCQGAIA